MKDINSIQAYKLVRNGCWDYTVWRGDRFSSQSFKLSVPNKRYQFAEGDRESLSPLPTARSNASCRGSPLASPQYPLWGLNQPPFIRIWKSGVKEIQARGRCGMSTGCSLRCVIRAAWPDQKDERDESRLIPGVIPVQSYRTYFPTQRGNPLWINDNTRIHVLGEATSPFGGSITGSILITLWHL